MFENLFHLKEHKTTTKVELMAGLTTFVTMAYILAVNPNMLSVAGMDQGGVLAATCLASFVGCLMMALLANYPFALAPGMGLNAYFTYTVCGVMGYPWQVALLAVFVEGIIFILLSLTNVREAVFNAIPMSLKHGASAGIGLFIAFIGLQNAHLVVKEDFTLVTSVKFAANFHTEGICALLAVAGVLLIAILYIKKVKAAILIGIVATWLLGMICQAAGIYVPNPEAGYYSLFPAQIVNFHMGSLFSSFSSTAFHIFDNGLGGIGVLDFIAVMFAFLFVDLFDTLGALIGLASKADMLDQDGKLAKARGALLADAIATSVGALFGTSTTTTYVESSAGIAAGGRTGLTALTTGVLFLLALPFGPLFTSIPGFATAPALIFVGFLMISSVLKIDFDQWEEAVPAYLCLLVMPLAYSVSEGLSIGIISYVVIHVCLGKAYMKKVTLLMYILCLLFVCKYIFL